MNGDTQAMSVGQRPAPTGHVRDLFDDSRVSARVDRMILERVAVVRIFGAIVSRIHLARLAKQFQQMIFRIHASEVREFIDEADSGERVENIADRTQPADAQMRFGISRFDLHVGDVVGIVDQAEIEFEAAWARSHRIEGRLIDGKQLRCNKLVALPSVSSPAFRYCALTE